MTLYFNFNKSITVDQPVSHVSCAALLLVLFAEAQGSATKARGAGDTGTELPLLPAQLPAVGIGGPAQCSLQTSEDTVRWSKGITEPRGKTSSAWDVLLLQRYHTGSFFISLFVFLSLINISGVLGTADKSAASSSSSVTHPRRVDDVTQWKGRQDYRRCRQCF